VRVSTFAICFIALAQVAIASTIDVTGNSSVVIQNGDALNLQVLDSDFIIAANSLGFPPTPTDIFFQLSTLPLSNGGTFTASIRSQDGLTTADFYQPFGFTPGSMMGGNYSGPTSAVSGWLHFAPGLAAPIFLNAPTLILQYSGPTITVGLPELYMPQDFVISLVVGDLGHSMSTGARQGQVLLQESAAAVPEPTAWALCLGGLWIVVTKRRVSSGIGV
jgi:hypothetical protein